MSVKNKNKSFFYSLFAQKKRSQKILIIALLLVGVFIIYQAIQLYITRVIEIPREGLVVVNKNISNKTYQNGSVQHPFDRLAKAITFIEKHPEFHIISLGPGTYQGPITLPAKTSLIGAGENTVIEIPATSSKEGTVITTEENNLIAHLKITGGGYGLVIQKDAGKTVLFDITITKAHKWGLLNQADSQANIPQVFLLHSSIVDNKDQGLYLQEGVFYIDDTEIARNGEEGLDLHRGTKTTVKNSNIIANGEGGIEFDLKDGELLIENSIIEKNGSSGVNLQSSGKHFKVLLKNNLIKENHKFGVRCSIHSGFKRGYFVKHITVENNNIIVQNPSGNISPICRR